MLVLWWWLSELSDSCVNSIHDFKSIRMFDDDVTSYEHALVVQGG